MFSAAIAAAALCVFCYTLFPFSVILPIAVLLIIYRHWNDRRPPL